MRYDPAYLWIFLIAALNWKSEEGLAFHRKTVAVSPLALKEAFTMESVTVFFSV